MFDGVDPVLEAANLRNVRIPFFICCNPSIFFCNARDSNTEGIRKCLIKKVLMKFRKSLFRLEIVMVTFPLWRLPSIPHDLRLTHETLWTEANEEDDEREGGREGEDNLEENEVTPVIDHDSNGGAAGTAEEPYEEDEEDEDDDDEKEDDDEESVGITKMGKRVFSAKASGKVVA